MVTDIMELSSPYFTKGQLGRKDFSELCVSIMMEYTWILEVHP